MRTRRIAAGLLLLTSGCSAFSSTVDLQRECQAQFTRADLEDWGEEFEEDKECVCSYQTPDCNALFKARLDRQDESDLDATFRKTDEREALADLQFIVYRYYQTAGDTLDFACVDLDGRDVFEDISEARMVQAGGLDRSTRTQLDDGELHAVAHGLWAEGQREARAEAVYLLSEDVLEADPSGDVIGFFLASDGQGSTGQLTWFQPDPLEFEIRCSTQTPSEAAR